MKRILFILFLLPCIAGAQNYTYEITPIPDGNFQVIQWDETNGTQGAPGIKWVFDTSELRLFTYQLIENQRSAEAAIQSSAFLKDLKVNNTVDYVGQFIPLDYQTWINSRLAGVYDGNWQYQVRGMATNVAIVIEGAELRLQSNNALIATLSARSNNWIRATVQASGEVIDLYQFGTAFVGKNAAGQVVTLKRL
jgi:hypothetical protein